LMSESSLRSCLPHEQRFIHDVLDWAQQLTWRGRCLSAASVGYY
jgi:hypothetical protein